MTDPSTSLSPWPELSRWQETRDTLLLWIQIVGKVRLAWEPMVNHWWQVPLYVSARGLTTSLMHRAGRGVEAEFDFLDDVLDLRTSDGERRRIQLQPRTVSSFYSETSEALEDLGLPLHMLARPVEIPVAIPFPEDHEHRFYDADAVRRFWRALVQAQRVMTIFRGRFIGKVSPVHFFWGAGDLAVTRFSGRRAPKHGGGVPNCADWVQVMAYSHEVSSCGFWTGNEGEGTFYAYAYPEPDGFSDWPVRPDAAYYDKSLGEFVLPYASVSGAENPDDLLLSFLQSTYEAAAELGQWDRDNLEAKSADLTPPVR
jgi:Family of unknown function (DUF5996)